MEITQQWGEIPSAERLSGTTSCSYLRIGQWPFVGGASLFFCHLSFVTEILSSSLPVEVCSSGSSAVWAPVGEKVLRGIFDTQNEQEHFFLVLFSFLDELVVFSSLCDTLMFSSKEKIHPLIMESASAQQGSVPLLRRAGGRNEANPPPSAATISVNMSQVNVLSPPLGQTGAASPEALGGKEEQCRRSSLAPPLVC